MEANRKRVKVHRIKNLTCEGSAWGELLTTTFGTPQHLYFTTDEEIKEGDWCYSDVDEEVYQMLEYNSKTGLSRDKDGTFILDGCRKIIAATDPKLRIGGGTGRREDGISIPLPQPSQALIKAYCEQGGIDEVDVEYETRTYDEWLGGDMIPETYKRLKVDPIHNTITTHRIVEKTYSISDIEAYCEKYSNDTELGREIRKLRYKQ